MGGICGNGGDSMGKTLMTAGMDRCMNDGDVSGIATYMVSETWHSINGNISDMGKVYTEEVTWGGRWQ